MHCLSTSQGFLSGLTFRIDCHRALSSTRHFSQAMRPVCHSLLLAFLLAFAFGLAAPAQAQEPADTIGVESALVDSLQAALDRFKVAEPPTARDSARLRRWADSVQAVADSLKDAIPLARPPLRLARRAYQSLADSSGIAGALFNAGHAYYSQGEYDKSLSKLRRALDLYREMGDQVGAVSSLLLITKSTRRQGGYEEALQRLTRLAETAREIEAWETLSQILYEMGLTHQKRGNYDKTLRLGRKALRISRKIGDPVGVRDARSIIGLAYLRQSRYEKALQNTRKALGLSRELGHQIDVSVNLNLIGVIYEDQGLYERALRYYREALKIARGISMTWMQGTASYNIGLIHQYQGRYGEALRWHQRALQLHRKRDARAEVASSLTDIGTVYLEQGRSEKALRRLREGLEVAREVGMQRMETRALASIGTALEKQSHYGKALGRYREALQISRRNGRKLGVADNLGRIGDLYLRQGRLPAATDTLQRAVHLSEKLRLSATSPEARRSLLSTQIDAYQALTTAHIRAGRPDSALRAAERARARLLADRLAGATQADTAFAIPSASELRRSLGPEEAALLYLNASTEWPLSVLAVTADTTYVRELPDSTIRRQIGREHRLALSRLRREEGPMKVALREGFTAASDDPGGPPSLGETIRLYRHQLTQVEGAPEMRRDLSRRFHRLLIQPVERAIAGKDELVVVPGGTLGYLPLEALRDPSGTYLVKKRRVRYAQSLTVLRQLRQREYEKRERPEGQRPLLALGGAAYGNPPTQRGQSLLATAYRGSTEVDTEERASALRRNAGRRLGRGESARPTYAELGFGRWRNLPGTKKEVERLGGIVGQGATVITGQAASEQKVRALSENGRLDDYRRVHLAAHGVSVPEAPALSALVLSQVGASDSLAARDGYLNMEEIAGLDLQADVAVLSACRTGLGRIVAGEGVVSLSHAFLRAGANATLVSQWKVLDESTRQFMTAVYERVKAEGTSFAEAVTETKRAFIDGTYGKKNTDPLRWAPFVYYGRE